MIFAVLANPVGNKMLSRLLSFVVLAAASFVCRADVAAVYGGIGYWNGSFGGDVISDVDVEGELALGTDNGATVYFGIEHPVPLLPNVRVARTDIQDSGVGTLSRDFVFGGVTYTVDQQVSTVVDLTHTDLTLYYEIVDVGMEFDVGLTGRWLQGEVEVNSTSENVDTVLPMVYARGKFYLPLSGLYLGADVNGISYSGNSLTDYALRLGWETDSFLFPEFGIEGGFRRFNVETDPDDTDVEVNVDLDGVFMTVTAHF